MQLGHETPLAAPPGFRRCYVNNRCVVGVANRCIAWFVTLRNVWRWSADVRARGLRARVLMWRAVVTAPRAFDLALVRPRRRLANAAFASNVVVTSKYTALNFVPLFLFHQFTRYGRGVRRGAGPLQASAGACD